MKKNFLIFVLLIIIVCMGIELYHNNKHSLTKDPYAKYKDEKDDYGSIIWLVKERLGNDNIDYEHLVYSEDINKHYPFLDLRNGKLYYIVSEYPFNEDDSKKDINDIKIDSIKGKVKFIFLINEKQSAAYESFFVITKDGGLWKNELSFDQNYNSFSLVKKFDDEIVDVTIINTIDDMGLLNSNIYYLLANGELLDQDGNPYEMNQR